MVLVLGSSLPCPVRGVMVELSGKSGGYSQIPGLHCAIPLLIAMEPEQRSVWGLMTRH